MEFLEGERAKKRVVVADIVAELSEMRAYMELDAPNRALGVGVVYNNARIALAERAWETARLRVLGFTRGEVSALLLYELGMELIVALPLGWVLGYWLSAGILALITAETFQIPLVIEARTHAYATVVTMLAGVVSALIVRRRIDTMDLTAVLKTSE